MIIQGGAIVAESASPPPLKSIDKRRAAIMDCPTCGARAILRSSGEITPQFRRLYYGCTNVKCGMTWAASLIFEHVLSPSGLGTTFRPARVRDDKPPGRDFGQMTIFDVLPARAVPETQND